jgi:hypothetical protein
VFNTVNGYQFFWPPKDMPSIGLSEAADLVARRRAVRRDDDERHALLQRAVLMTVRAVSSNPASPFYNANAPTLTGQVGSLTAVLDAVLVNGFTGFTALGWSINQTTTNKRGYKQNLTGSNNASGMLLYVDDTGPGAGAAREARVCGFETMSAITPTGTGQFPTSAQSAVGTGQLVIRKSTTADATTAQLDDRWQWTDVLSVHRERRHDGSAGVHDVRFRRLQIVKVERSICRLHYRATDRKQRIGAERSSSLHELS